MEPGRPAGLAQISAEKIVKTAPCCGRIKVGDIDGLASDMPLDEKNAVPLPVPGRPKKGN